MALYGLIEVDGAQIGSWSAVNLGPVEQPAGTMPGSWCRYSYRVECGGLVSAGVTVHPPSLTHVGAAARLGLRPPLAHDGDAHLVVAAVAAGLDGVERVEVCEPPPFDAPAPGLSVSPTHWSASVQSVTSRVISCSPISGQSAARASVSSVKGSSSSMCPLVVRIAHCRGVIACRTSRGLRTGCAGRWPRP